ncbi:dicarboxylate/amino acid:cation symporter [Chlamydiifrater phoenicopteri]|uniref:dicarboxylate/amino acid:cation symporter n=1 Tax=Chlamydiifrater phoenicopteri TaxID=2681469 RepID=UPI001BCAF0F1|nr:dicarboxylate/amino acid:cation symporter [Chlamydiifrater phoenicopteri]
MKLWMKILIGLLVGVASGLVFGDKAVLVKPVGDVFLNLLSMVVYPLVFASMVVGIASISDLKKLGRIGVKSLGLYLLTTAVAIAIGLFFAILFKPGSGCLIDEVTSWVAPKSNAKVSDIIVNLFPSNPVKSFVEGNILQIIIFSLFLGISIRLAGDKGIALEKFFNSVSEVMLQMINLVMEFAPFGVAASMAWISGIHGINILLQLGKFLAVFYLACFVHAVLVFGSLIRFRCGSSFLGFLRGMMDAIVCAASTASSSATLPVTMRCVSDRIGVSKEITGFVLPLGATVNMNGTAIFQGMAAVFIAQVYGFSLSFYSLVMLVITATFSAVGSAGVPGGGMITLSSVLASVGLPVQGVAILAGIDRLRDIVGTPMNILGDAVVATCVHTGEKDQERATLKSKEARESEMIGLAEGQ